MAKGAPMISHTLKVDILLLFVMVGHLTHMQLKEYILRFSLADGEPSLHI
jgi:hypothetical protein